MIELLAVIGLLLLLLGLLLPTFSHARIASHRTACLGNLHAIALATRLYVNRNQSYPPAWQGSECRWMDLVKPYADEKASALYRCPSDSEQIPVAWDPEIILGYGINTFRFADEAHCFWYAVKAGAVARPAETILFADCTPGYYYCGGGSVFTDPVNRVDYRHGGEFGAAYCDGRADSRAATTREDWDASR